MAGKLFQSLIDLMEKNDWRGRHLNKAIVSKMEAYTAYIPGHSDPVLVEGNSRVPR